MSGSRRWNLLVVLAVGLIAACSAPVRQTERFGAVADSSASAGNELSKARQQQLIDAFVGREMVFRVLWYEYSVLDPDPDFSNPTNLKAVTARFPTMNVKVPAGAWERQQLAVGARPGDVVKVTGVHFLRDSITLFTRKPDRSVVVVSVWMPRGRTIIGTKTNECCTRQVIDDHNLTAQWLEDVLSGSIVEFVAPAARQVALPAAAEGLVLQPPPGLAAAATPGVRLLSAEADPGRLRPGDTLRLSMQFAVEGVGADGAAVQESYELSQGGVALPRFPVLRTETRQAGEHRGVFTQQIPRGAQPGTYRFKAEVCLEGSCSSRVTEFAIVR